MSDAAIALPTRLSRRIEKLAREAGHTPDEMLKFVIHDGLEYCEYAVKSANEGLADLDAGRSVTAEGMRRTSRNAGLRAVPGKRLDYAARAARSRSHRSVSP